MGKVVIFSSHSHVLPFVITETIVADCIYKNSRDPIILKPDICTCQNYYFYTENPTSKKKTCNSCRANELVLKNACPEFIHRCLSDQLFSYSDIDEYNKFKFDVLSAPVSKLLLLKYNSIPVGRIALFDIILKYKVINLNFQHEVLESYKRKILDCILTIQKFKNFLSNFPDIDTLLVYNSHYSINRSVFDLCNSNGLKTYSLHNGPSFKYIWDTLSITKINNHEPLHNSIKNWSNGYSDQTLNNQQIISIWEHINELFQSKSAHVYSSSVGSNAYSYENTNNKVILINTSSADEIFANVESGICKFEGPCLFEDQTQWLRFLIGKALANPEITFIIRVHPREFPNKRDEVKSQHAYILEELFIDLPKNIRINWPSDNVSIYDIIPNVDLVLTLYSSVGLEASAFGCPIILPLNPICSYSAVADSISKSKEEYWSDIIKALDSPWEIERAIKTFRWLWVNHFAALISLESSDCREPTLVERLVKTKNKLLTMLKLKKIGFLLDTSIAYHGQGWQISRRRKNVKGECLIVKQILEHENLDDFNSMHYPITNTRMTALPAMLDDEKRAVTSVLSKMFVKVGRPKKWVE